MEISGGDGTACFSTRACTCYRVAGLSETILESTQVSNLKDRYVLEEQLGWGQFGVISACSDKFTREVLACKSIAKDRLIMPENMQSVKLEIEIMTKLSGHPNIVNLKAVYEEEDYVHLLMELCMGGELFHRIEKHGRFPEAEARFLFRHLMDVVKYCHDNGVVHRDLKPENILLVSTSRESPIKVADFGLATYIKPGQYLHGTVGSPFYIAPEVLSGGYNQAADVWSAGVILYILLSGLPPFWGKTKSKIFEAVRAANLRFPSSHWDRVSSSAKDLIAGMLQLDPSKRLNTSEVLGHQWMKGYEQILEESPQIRGNVDHEILEVDADSFSGPCVMRSEDYSFGQGSRSTDENSLDRTPTFSCKTITSFANFMTGEGTETPLSAFSRFSFGLESSAGEFSCPISSMLSFTFFSPSTAADEPGDAVKSIDISVHSVEDKESRLTMLLELTDASTDGKHGMGEMELDGYPSKTQMVRIHNRRNRTIGFGEQDHINLEVPESVIRWASCTHIPTAPSLRLSLVC